LPGATKWNKIRNLKKILEKHLFRSLVHHLDAFYAMIQARLPRRCEPSSCFDAKASTNKYPHKDSLTPQIFEGTKIDHAAAASESSEQ
jgi:hypothetical protein